MAEKKVVGLDNLKIFYNKLKDIFVPKLEGKNYLTSSTGTEGYTKAEIDSKINNISSSGSSDNINLNWQDQFEDIIYNSTSADFDNYTYYYLDNGIYKVVTYDQIMNWVNTPKDTTQPVSVDNNILEDQEFYFNKILSHTTPAYGIGNTISTYLTGIGAQQITNIAQKTNYTSYNRVNDEIINKAYPAYFSYYKKDTTGNFIQITQMEAKTLGNTNKIEIFVKNLTPENIENLITSSDIQTIIDNRIKALVKADSLN